MADQPQIPEWLRLMAERRGLTRALALTPAFARPALERAALPLLPESTGAATEPAGWIAPEATRDET